MIAEKSAQPEGFRCSDFKPASRNSRAACEVLVAKFQLYRLKSHLGVRYFKTSEMAAEFLKNQCMDARPIKHNSSLARLKGLSIATVTNVITPEGLKIKLVTSMAPLQPYQPPAWGGTRPGSDLSHIGSLHAGQKIPCTPAKSQGAYANKTRITEVLKARP